MLVIYGPKNGSSYGGDNELHLGPWMELKRDPGSSPLPVGTSWVLHEQTESPLSLASDPASILCDSLGHSVSVCISYCDNLGVPCPAGGSADALWVWMLVDKGRFGEIYQKTGRSHWYLSLFSQNTFSAPGGYWFLFISPTMNATMYHPGG